MNVLTDNAKLFVLQERTWGIALLCLLLLGTTILQAYQMAASPSPEWIKAGVLILAAIGLGFAVYFYARRTLVTFDKSRKLLTVQINSLRENRTHRIPFSDITSITIELHRRQHHVQVGRCVVHTDTESLPLSQSFSKNVDPTVRMAEKMRGIVGLDREAKDDSTSSLTDESVHELVKSGQTIQATRVLTTLKGMSTTDARTEVKRIERSLESGEGP